MTITRTLALITLIVLAAACQTAAPPPPATITPPPPAETLTLYTDYISYPDFVNYPTLTHHNVTNPTSTPFVNRQLHTRCRELGIDTHFRSAPITIQPGEVVNVRLPYYSGYRMMVDAGAQCYTHVPSVAGQPAWITRRHP